MLGRLIPTGGGDDIFLKKEELTLGRSSKNDIVLRFSNISAKHCRLVLSNGYWYVIDSGSTNGVRVNSIRVTDQRIDPESKVTFADHSYILHYNPSENGGDILPPDTLESNPMEKSLFERAGIANMKGFFHRDKAKKEAPKEIDFDSISLDDIEFLKEE